MNARMDKAKLNIGAYYLHPCARSEQHIKDVRDCGVDFVVCMDNDRAALDLFKKHGLGAVVKGIVPSWWGGNTEKSGKMHLLNPLPKYQSGIESFCDHPAVWGIDMGDEPSSADMEHIGKALDIVENGCPNLFGYINLFPSYGSHADKSPDVVRLQLSTDSYQEYIKSYIKYVNTDYICFDFYVYTSEVSRFYRDLFIASKANRELWTVLQVNTFDKNRPLSKNMLRYQAFCAMAFGAKNIIWACYSHGWWHYNVLDEQGGKTEQYAKLQAVNREIHALGEKYMRYDHRDIHLVGDFGCGNLPKASEKELCAGFFDKVCAKNSSPLLVGEMAAKSGTGGALMILPADDPLDTGSREVCITFDCTLPKVRVYCSDGEIPAMQNGSNYIIKVRSNQGALITAE